MLSPVSNSREASPPQPKNTESPDIIERRRALELELIGRYDSSSINPRRECWFIVSTQWLEAWANFVRGEGERPGKIDNSNLMQDDCKTPKSGLKAKTDYRGVNPTVWYLYTNMYGKDDITAEICRYVCDIYEPEVPSKYKQEMIEAPARRAELEVQKLEWLVDPPPLDDIVESGPIQRFLRCLCEPFIDCFLLTAYKCCCCILALKKRSNNNNNRAYERVGQEDTTEMASL